jgi:hypothetical protein
MDDVSDILYKSLTVSTTVETFSKQQTLLIFQ